MTKSPINNIRFEWVDALKAFAILGILLNHFIEEYGAGPWFSNPSYQWPPFNFRISHILPCGTNIVTVSIRFLGWLGDMGPGVFILLSGFTLTWNQLRKEKQAIIDFYKARIIRIFPLYIAIHFLVLVFALIVKQPADINLLSSKTLLSFLGLRFSDALFFYINPSWWFIWLILQLYLIFPLLFKLLRTKGATFFIVLTLGITVVSRAAGLFHLTYSNNLYYWMTGIFAGTRLIEFTLGMLLAKLLNDNIIQRKIQHFNTARIFLYSLIIYFVGFICSWTYVGSMISNMMITVGLSGIFYGIFKGLLYKPTIKNPTLFIGKNSFSVFLIHQPFMRYFGEQLSGISKFLVLLSIIFFSFPVGYLIEKTVARISIYYTNNLLRITHAVKQKPFQWFLIGFTLIIIASHALLLIINTSIPPFVNVLTALYLILLILYLITTFQVYHKRFASPEIDLSHKDDSIYRIFIVRDSFAMPEGIDYQESFPYLLEKRLKESVKEKTIQVINRGVTGHGPNERLAQIRKYIDTIRPDLIINEFIINEFHKINYTPEQRLTNPGFYGHYSKRKKFWGHSQLAKYYEKILRYITQRPDPSFNYNKSLLYLYAKNSVYYSDTVIQKIDDYLKNVKQLCDHAHIDYWLMYVPGQIEVSPKEYIRSYHIDTDLNDTCAYDLNFAHKIMRSQCAKHDIILLDTKNLLKNHTKQPVYFEKSLHWNKTGHKLIAEMLADKIRTQFN